MSNNNQQDKNTLKNDLNDVRNKAGQTGQAISKAAGHLTENLREGAKDAYHNAADRASDVFHDAADRASDAYDRVKDVAKSSYKRIKDGAIDAEESVIATIKKHPVASIGAAVLGGIILAMLLRKD